MSDEYATMYDSDTLGVYYQRVLTTLINANDAPISNETMSRLARNLWVVHEALRAQRIELPALPEHIEALLILEGLG